MVVAVSVAACLVLPAATHGTLCVTRPVPSCASRSPIKTGTPRTVTLALRDWV